MSDDLQRRVRALGLHGLLADWGRYQAAPWVAELVTAEEAERKRRSLERRVKGARIGRFKPMADFDWSWPKSIDRQAVEDLFTFGWADLSEPSNVVLVGPNGIGKTMVSQNLGHQAILRGYTVKFTTASAMLNDLASQDGAKGLQLAIRRYCRPQILVLDEVGYLSYDNRHADLLFEIVTRRYGQKPIVVTTNKAFGEWNEVFPNAACVVTLVDRLVHASEILRIDGDSYRLKEAKERADRKARTRKAA
jgi:DNA replication protein DnaC